jgi:hypothetical protein
MRAPWLLLSCLAACNLIGGIEPGEPECRTDGARNGRETDVDCGGPCARCDDGKACFAPSDCQSDRCEGAVCQPIEEACTLDGELNGEETDVDCGGPCPPCQVGDDCFEHEDCLSNSCIDLTCAVPECFDDRKNGDESDIDCGGHSYECIRCQGGSTCNEDTDCASYHLAYYVLGVNPCQDGVCLASCVYYDCEGCDDHCGIQDLDTTITNTCCPTDVAAQGIRLSDCDMANPNSCLFPLHCFQSGIMEATCL